jgi:BirA family biotin operon repressor/biotin-[acetyl-CoA-carboxylase] ligase
MKPIGHTILRFEEVPSTNTLLMDSPEHLENHGLVAIARHQTAGRGRVGRRWASLPGRQLQFSVVLHPPLPRERVSVVSLVIGLAVARALKEGLGLAPVLKWPNDVFLNGKKVCGVLVEMKQGPGGAPRLVVGIGINCLGSPAEFPPEVRDGLTTVAHEAGREVDGEQVFADVLAQLRAVFEQLGNEELPDLLKQWEAFADMKGRPVRYPLPAGQAEGTAEGLTPEGNLVIRTAEGGSHVHSSGELEWLG